MENIGRVIMEVNKYSKQGRSNRGGCVCMGGGGGVGVGRGVQHPPNNCS